MFDDRFAETRPCYRITHDELLMAEEGGFDLPIPLGPGEILAQNWPGSPWYIIGAPQVDELGGHTYYLHHQLSTIYQYAATALDVFLSV